MALYNREDHFHFWEEKVRNEQEIYKNFEVSEEDYAIEKIYLTDDEIIEFNRICEEEGLDLKVLPLSQFTERYLEVDDDIIDEEIDIFSQTFIDKAKEDEEKQNNSLNSNQHNFNLDYKIKYVNEYIGKKQKKNITESDYEDKSDEKHSDYEENSKHSQKSPENMDEINKMEIEQPIETKKRDIQKILNKNKNKSNKIIEDEEDVKYNIKKKKNEKKEETNDNFFKYFGKIRNSSIDQQNEIKRKKDLIDKILENSQYLTKEQLNEISQNNHIKIVGHQLSIYDLKQKRENQLNDILVNINYNSKFGKLEPNRENIRNILNKEEMERKKYERALERKRQKEEKMRNKQLMNNNEQNNNENKMEEEDESESSIDDNSLN